MHFQTLLLSTLAAFATASPAALEARDEWVGYAFGQSGQLVGDLIRNGGCCSFLKAYSAEIHNGVRCRFFRYVFLHPHVKDDALTRPFCK
jgi:hypothetical protein